MNSPFDDDMLQTYTDAELAHYILTSPQHPSPSQVALLSSTLVAKIYPPSLLKDVVEVTRIVRRLGVRVPQIRRIIAHKKVKYCIMDRVQGATLEEVWTRLDEDTTTKIALQLRCFIDLLRSLTSSTAGSVETGECRSFWLDDKYGLPLQSTPDDIASFIHFWFNFKSLRKEVEKATHTTIDAGVQSPLTRQTFVLTHHDLAPRNIMLDPSGQLWLIDWDFAGFYPIYFEYAAMNNFHIPSDWDESARERWHLFCDTTVGTYEQEASILKEIRWRFTRFAAGRRFQLMKRGGPTRYPVS